MSESPSLYAFAYQPILNSAQASVAVELHIRAAPNANAAPEAAQGAAQSAAQLTEFATANAFVNVFAHSGLDDLLRTRKVFIPAPRALLGSELLALLPASRVALEISCADEASELCIARWRELRAKGYTLVLDGYDAAMHPAALLEAVDYVAVDARAVAVGALSSLLESWSRGPARLMARHVDTRADFDALRHHGCELYQGYYFAHRTEVAARRSDPRKLALLDLLARLEDDQDDQVIEASFKTNPALALQLLRLVNSSAFALNAKIHSIKHAFTILGRRQLMRWLRVLLYALDGDGGQTSPLMELAMRRAHFMEFVLTYRTHQPATQLQDAAFIVGLLSLADVVMDWSLAKVAERLCLADQIKQALLERRGVLGRLIDLCERLEAADFDAVSEIVAELQLPLDGVIAAQQAAMTQAHAFGDEPPAVGNTAAEPA